MARSRSPVAPVDVAGFSFLDADVTLGVENVPLRGRELGSGETLDRLLECGIGEALVAHNAAIEGDPASGNELLARALADPTLTARGVGLHPAWVLAALSAGDFGSPEELRGRLERGGVRGVLLYPEMHGYSGSPWCCGEIYELCEAMRMPLFTRLHLDFSFDALHALLSSHPGLRLILRNADYRMTRSLYRLFDLFEHLAVETGRFSPFLGVEDVVRRWGERRLVFGSGAPSASPGAAVSLVLLADIGEQAKRRIAGENLRDLMRGIRYGG